VSRLRLEFTVEPFVPGAPGPHVRAAVAAVEAAGFAADFGPFSTASELPAEAIGGAVAALLDAAFAAGATRVSLNVARVAEV
jgi:hypothetical protein